MPRSELGLPDRLFAVELGCGKGARNGGKYAVTCAQKAPDLAAVFGLSSPVIKAAPLTRNIHPQSGAPPQLGDGSGVGSQAYAFRHAET